MTTTSIIEAIEIFDMKNPRQKNEDIFLFYGVLPAGDLTRRFAHA